MEDLVLSRVALVAVTITLLVPSRAVASDPVLDWIGVMNESVLTAGTTPLSTSRAVGLVGASMFDAVNGIEKRYQPLMVDKYTGPHASSRAAAVQAAYAMLLRLYPTQAATLNARRAASLAAIAAAPGADQDKEIVAGIAYGQFVADSIFAARSLDGFAPDPAPPFVGIDRLGIWRPTGANQTGAGPQFATMTPWVLIRGSQFRLPPPPALGSPEYVADYNETILGVAGNAHEAEARFWAGNTALYWNRIAAQVAASRDLSLVETAHLFGLLNVSMADAAIACWDGKYRYVFWRPVTAIHLSTANGIPDSTNAAWAPLLATPAHPEYPSGHSTLSGAAKRVLETAFGDNVAFTVSSEVTNNTRSFVSFSDALEEIHNARVFAGIHFRTACRLGSDLGMKVADWVMGQSMQDRGNH
jgi:hypothetical protein